MSNTTRAMLPLGMTLLLMTFAFGQDVGFSVPVELEQGSDPLRFRTFDIPSSVPVFQATIGADGSGSAPNGGIVHNGCGYKPESVPPTGCECVPVQVSGKPEVNSCGAWDIGSGVFNGDGKGWCYTNPECDAKNPASAWGSIKAHGDVAVCDVPSDVSLDTYACAKPHGIDSEVLCPVIDGGVTCPASHPYPSSYHLGRDERWEGCNLKDLVTCKEEPPNGALSWMPFLPDDTSEWADYSMQGSSFMTSRKASTFLNHKYKVTCWINNHVRCGSSTQTNGETERPCASAKTIEFLQLEHCPQGNEASCGATVYKPGDSFPAAIQDFADKLCLSAATIG